MKDHHSHTPSSSHQSNKPFKSKHATKGQLKEVNKGKVNRNKVNAGPKATASKSDRRNAAKIAQKAKREELSRVNRSIGGVHGASKLVAIIPLCSDISSKDIFTKLVNHPELTLPENRDRNKTPSTLYLDKFRQKFTFFHVERDVNEILEACKVADFLILGYSAEVEVDEYGELCLACIMAQGVPSVASVVVGMEPMIPKKKAEARKALVSYIVDFFPEDDKLFTVDTEPETFNLLRHLSTAHAKSVLWRDRHPYMLVEDVESEASPENPETVTLKVTGYSRGKSFSANRLVYLHNYGDFQVNKIETCPDPIYMMRYSHRRERTTSVRSEVSEMSVDGASDAKHENLMKKLLLHTPDPEERDTLLAENPVDPLANDQTLLDDEEVNEAEVQYEDIVKGEARKKLVPKGTSSYQAAWIVEDEDGEDGEDDDEEGSMDDGDDQQSRFDQDEEQEELEEVGVDERGQAEDEDFDEEENEQEYQKYLKQKTQESRDDLEFPDEVDTPTNVPAQKRFGKYRGLKSFRTSPWDPYENLPLDYARIFDFQDFKRTQRRVLSEDEGANPYQYLTIHIANVPKEFMEAYKDGFGGLLNLFGLLQHERKTSVLHYNMTRHPSFEDPVKSKDPLIIHTGFRCLVGRPIYSQNAPGNKQKFERFFQPGRTSIATIYGPIQYPPSPALFFKDNGPGKVPSLVATGTLHSVDPKRVIVKRIILTGSPFKINKRHATIRYMFFNPEDVMWFKPVELRSKYGRVGHIKESLGTHGYMKCVFNAQLKAQDTVCLYLYKRVFPKWKAELYSGQEIQSIHRGEGEEEEEEEEGEEDEEDEGMDDDDE